MPLERKNLLTRNPCHWILGLGGHTTWTNRELEWYLAEERLLFSCLSEEECDRWVTLLHWLKNKA